MTEQDEFLLKIERFIKRHQMGHTTFGLKAVGRLGFVGRLRAGGGVTLETKQAVIDWMRAYKPAKRGAGRKKKQTVADAA